MRAVANEFVYVQMYVSSRFLWDVVSCQSDMLKQARVFSALVGGRRLFRHVIVGLEKLKSYDSMRNEENCDVGQNSRKVPEKCEA